MTLRIAAVRPISMAMALSLAFCLNIGVGEARTITFSCTDEFAGGDAKVRLTYEGEAEGTVSVAANIGMFTLPANLTTIGDPGGPQLVGISASGTVALKLPAFETLEACEEKQTFPPINRKGILNVFHSDSCFRGLPLSPDPVSVQADIKFYLDPSQPTAEVNDLNLLYPQMSAKFGGQFRLSALPPRNCVLVPK